jgi:hypothetical protein
MQIADTNVEGKTEKEKRKKRTGESAVTDRLYLGSRGVEGSGTEAGSTSMVSPGAACDDGCRGEDGLLAQPHHRPPVDPRRGFRNPCLADPRKIRAVVGGTRRRQLLRSRFS